MFPSPDCKTSWLARNPHAETLITRSAGEMHLIGEIVIPIVHGRINYRLPELYGTIDNADT